MPEKKAGDNYRSFSPGDGVQVGGHKGIMGPAVSVNFERHRSDVPEGPFLSIHAQIAPAVARELSAALLAAADYAEGKS